MISHTHRIRKAITKSISKLNPLAIMFLIVSPELRTRRAGSRARAEQKNVD